MSPSVPNSEQRGPNDSLKLIFGLSDRDMLIETHRIAVEVLRKLEAIDQRVLELERDQQRTQGAVKTLAVLWAVGIAAIMAYFGWKQAGNH